MLGYFNNIASFKSKIIPRVRHLDKLNEKWYHLANYSSNNGFNINLIIGSNNETLDSVTLTKLQNLGIYINTKIGPNKRYDIMRKGELNIKEHYIGNSTSLNGETLITTSPFISNECLLKDLLSALLIEDIDDFLNTGSTFINYIETLDKKHGTI